MPAKSKYLKSASQTLSSCSLIIYNLMVNCHHFDCAHSNSCRIADEYQTILKTSNQTSLGRFYCPLETSQVSTERD